MTTTKRKTRVPALVKPILDALYRQGILDEVLAECQSTYARRQRFLWICAYVYSIARAFDLLHDQKTVAGNGQLRMSQR